MAWVPALRTGAATAKTLKATPATNHRQRAAMDQKCALPLHFNGKDNKRSHIEQALATDLVHSDTVPIEGKGMWPTQALSRRWSTVVIDSAKKSRCDVQGKANTDNS
ncbi:MULTISPECIES: hypothetical protein [unclassified Cyanobium]|uniref:hypothetical protein n=1 Tax=unclassified Cyanobium TaxID=2627006 RepID=UPI0020CEFF74|nr:MULTISPECIES: hypothetical protein [unclassified Cyanobium]MCP9834950.1 hypothetical protein [Cyanobium sp. La Preciosa 7G6]MCP9937713.1 hypothetical protein [Cyanobium sp. Aljojuca 7A6]